MGSWAIRCLLSLACLAGVLGSVVDKGHSGCGECRPETCPRSPDKCPAGAVPDPCGCCAAGVCGAAEGHKCHNASLPQLPPEARKYPPCGDHLACLLRQDLRPYMDLPEALCACRETEVACGSDNRTYDSVCQLKQEARLKGFPNDLFLKHWGPCRSVPEIVSGPQDSSSAPGEALALDCEVKGYPIPAVDWEFRSEDGSTRMLPSDDQYVAVQVRGGPEPYMVTSWVQIASLRHKDSGVYTCVAASSEGVSRAAATVGVRG
ncbi:insulin-like growth factor-binding protein-related protein 1 [Bacillus rossius redtenbacheri]|uniref:insulin-like growth factor-binding protein-related protein 1 n=1 Tax=Bacillus rossius redtenbacheri TaxID=93214 RepID=UPI002FDE4C8D